MKTFRIVVKTRKGTEEREIEALDLQAARRAGRKYGQVISCKKVNRFNVDSPLSPADRQIFLQRLGAMQESKVGAGEALALMEQTFAGAVKKTAGRMLKLIENGDDIGQAMGRMGDSYFPSNVVALVQAGSKGGDTGKALKNAAEFEVEMERIKRESGKGIWSGIAGILSAVGIVFGTTMYFGPMIMDSDLVKIGGDDMKVGWALILGDYLEIAAIVVLTVLVSLWLLGNLGKKINARLADKLILKIPFYKDLALAKNNYTVLYGLAMLAHSGVSMEAALKLSADSAPKGALKDDLMAATGAVKVGKPWAMAMKTLHPTDKAALSTSEDREQIARTLEALSYQYRALYGQRVSTLAPVLQAVAMLFLIAAGAVLFGQTVMPILKLAGGGLM
ncbi:type II secretion system F family protein [Neptuniibacter sp. QD37_11]|uniref:type II secretion system F family protein n=1 Tax=Neptuniibacter sp. QD37_11 TaxID=3398209 RepID=UPI0039F475A9